ncbi:MAG: RsmE family RNA methyltransferase [Patescibacteria group bacterium]
MKLQRFFIEEQLRNKKDITLYDDDLIHQLKDVFRLRVGDQIMLLDNSGFEYLAEVVLLARGKGEIKIIDQSAAINVPKEEVWLFASLIKKDNYEWILEKCTELGVSHFVPIVSDRTEKKDLNSERAQKIIKEASEQSERGVMPVLYDVHTLEQTLEKYAGTFPIYAFHIGQEFPKFNYSEIKNKHADRNASLKLPEEPIGIFVGPEGGWTEKEVELFKQHSVQIYSLGNQVLRAETAAIAISSLVLL